MVQVKSTRSEEAAIDMQIAAGGKTLDWILFNAHATKRNLKAFLQMEPTYRVRIRVLRKMPMYREWSELADLVHPGDIAGALWKVYELMWEQRRWVTEQKQKDAKETLALVLLENRVAKK